MKKVFIVADIKDLEKQVSSGEISYSRMVEIMNEKCEQHYSQPPAIAGDVSDWKQMSEPKKINTLLTLALRNLSSDGMDTLAESLYERCSEELKSKMQGRKQGWVSVKDEDPKNRQRILMFCEREFSGLDEIVIGEYMKGDYENFMSADFAEDEIPTITHWMPLPPAPNQEGGEG